MHTITQGARLVPGIACWNDPQFIELKLRNSRLRHGHMGQVRWIEGTPQDANALWCQTQSLGFKNLEAN